MVSSLLITVESVMGVVNRVAIKLKYEIRRQATIKCGWE